ncbi:hypothetical protein Q3G72_023066 [Acer saccharum]|nr:hypothetical protein Q3G72_023066 [Acer saccharum]
MSCILSNIHFHIVYSNLCFSLSLLHINWVDGSYASDDEDDNYDSEVDDAYASEDIIRHLQKLHLESSSYKEIFSYEDDKTDVENLIKLVPSSVAMD